MNEEGYIHNQEIISKYEELVTMDGIDVHELEDTLSESLDTLNREDGEVSTAILKILQYVQLTAAPFRKKGLEDMHRRRKYLNTILNDKQRAEVYKAGLEMDDLDGNYKETSNLYHKLEELNLPELEGFDNYSIKMDIAKAYPPILGVFRNHNKAVYHTQRNENVYYDLISVLNAINDTYIELAGIIPIQDNTKEKHGENTMEYLYYKLAESILKFYNCKTIKQGREKEKMIQLVDEYYKPLTWWSISEAISIATTLPHSKILEDDIHYNLNQYLEESSAGTDEEEMKDVKIIL